MYEVATFYESEYCSIRSFDSREVRGFIADPSVEVCTFRGANASRVLTLFHICLISVVTLRYVV